MMKLTVLSGGKENSYNFDQESVTIGASTNPQTDLSLPNETLLTIHLKILRNNEDFTLINCANDPFATLNDLPFGRKKLKNGDKIGIGHTTLSFQFSEKKLPVKLISPNETATDAPTKPLNDDEIEELIKQAEKLSSSPKTAPEKETEEDDREEQKKAEQYFVDEFDDESEMWNPQNDSDESFFRFHFRKRYGLLISLLLSLIFITSTLSTLFYFDLSGKSDKDEIMAMQAVADVAMALLQAQVDPQSLQKQNWSHPEFLKENLHKILPPTNSPIDNLDNHGQLKKYNYLLRIYNSNDLNRFLVIAQPENSLMHSFFPKCAIIVDSNVMELRKTHDLKTLNRLLVAPNPLDNDQSSELTALIESGEKITLAQISKKSIPFPFAPSKTLATLKPGAENLIYNAPRYYLFGQKLLDKVREIIERQETTTLSSSLKEQIAIVTRFPSIVFYSSLGRKHALEMQQLLMTLNHPKDLVAYLTFKQDGSIASSNFLMNQNALIALPRENWKEIGLNTNPSTIAFIPSIANLKSPTTPNPELLPIDHPLSLQLATLYKQLKEEMQPRFQNLLSVIASNDNILSKETIEKLQQQIATYEKELAQKQVIIEESIVNLYRQNSDMSLSQFSSFLRASGFSFLIEPNLVEKLEEIEKKEEAKRQINSMLKQIKKTQNLGELSQPLNQIHHTLKDASIPPEAIPLIEQALTSAALVKIDQFLLSRKENPFASSFEESQIQLKEILNQLDNLSDKQRTFYMEKLNETLPPSILETIQAHSSPDLTSQ